jgi:hypothetical protein
MALGPASPSQRAAHERVEALAQPSDATATA